MGRKTVKDQRLLIANNMPPLHRVQPGQDYDHKKDKVLEWISERPLLQMYLFDKLNAGGFILFDPETKTWQGADHDD